MLNHNLVRLLLVLSMCLIVVTACTRLPMTPPPSSQISRTELTQLRVCDSTSVNSIILQFAQQSGIFEKYGLTVELWPVSGNTEGIAALIADEVDLCHIGGGGTVNAALAGEDMAIVAGTINKPFFALVARPEIGSVQDMKGKAIATGSAGSSSEIFLRLILPIVGLEATDIGIIGIGSSADRLAAMETGQVSVGVVTVPEVISAKELGFHVVLDASGLDFPYQHTVIAVKRSMLENNRQTLLHFLQALTEAIAIMKQDRGLTTMIMAEYLGMDAAEDAALLNEIFDSMVLGYWMETPYPSKEGVQFLIDVGRQENPNAVELTPDDLIDSSLIQELEESGFIGSLYPEEAK